MPRTAAAAATAAAATASGGAAAASSDRRQAAFGHSGRVFGLAFNPASADVIASASEDESVRVWRRSQGGAAAAGGWTQTSCCRGHTSEVLRVAWGPCGTLLASGSADHTVRLWQAGGSAEASYAGAELAVLGGHPEEVYAVHFLSSSSSTASQSAAAAAAAGGSRSSSSSGLLLSASGDSLYLWDLAAGQLVQQSCPLPAMRRLSRGLTAPQAAAGTTAAAAGLPVAGQQNGVAGGSTQHAGALQQQQQQQHEDEEEDEEEEDDDEPAPAYIFGVAVSDAASLVAANCSDGMLRVWDASKQSLLEVGAVLAHPQEMGSCCAFVPGQPLLLASISKGGGCVLQDLRLLGRPLMSAQLQGPVYDAAFVAAAPAALTAAAAGSSSSSLAGGGDGGSGSSSAGKELWLLAAGWDSNLRCYALTAAALQSGTLPAPHLLPMPARYPGSLLCVTASADGKHIAAAGEAVPAQALQQQQPAPAPAAAAAPQQGAPSLAAARRRRSKAAAAAVDLLSLEDDGVTGGAAALTIQQQQQHVVAGGADAASGAPPPDRMAFSGAAACAAAAAGVLLRAPVFVVDL